MNAPIAVNGTRLWDRLMEMAQIGATEKGGVCRVALSDEDKIGRDLFVAWCEEANCKVSVDEMGNIFARREGLQPDAAPVMAGSHLDSQPTGGKYDGVYGVLAALEVVDTLNDLDIKTDAPVEIVSWTNEEGARFPPGLLGSGVWSGEFELEYGLSRTDQSGLTIGQELKRIGYAGDVPAKARPFKAAFEIHIEQGPILEREKKTVGIVTGVQGARWYRLTIEGKEAHAGSTPMGVRKDPVKAALDMFKKIYALADATPNLVVTFGHIQTPPNSINTVPGNLITSLDMRHPDEATLEAMHSSVSNIIAETSSQSSLPIDVEEIWHTTPIKFNEGCIESVRKAAEISNTSAMEIVSGAGHDAVYLSDLSPTSMIFIPCEDGLSHNELEEASRDDVIAGCNVLFHAVLDQAMNT
jgi:N-carbamoyl-L-amino-acid hydrolase